MHTYFAMLEQEMLSYTSTLIRCDKISLFAVHLYLHFWSWTDFSVPLKIPSVSGGYLPFLVPLQFLLKLSPFTRRGA